MPKHSTQRVDFFNENNRPAEDKVESVYIPVQEYKTVSVRLRIDANYKVTGKGSGQGYLFAGAGSTQDVDERDVEWLLELRRGKACCGGGGESPLFELAGE